MKQQYLLQQLLQLGILIMAFGMIMSLIGLYPGITGVEPRAGTGILQIILIILGVWLVIIGQFVLAKISFYPRIPNTLAQRVAIRLSLTALLFLGAVGMSDVLGYGSNPPQGEISYPVMGAFQAAGIVMGFIAASFGVLLFVLTGDKVPADDVNRRRLPDYRRETEEHSSV